ncbi:styrene monooxygenase/indole monooxygenase family protein [Actinoalloteichus spitiensis]|uniref:styrene monooxygenase/indole monooxygenase family protein n=1 Tax=Actinoalloteichus spitiensis TaxID=252394 RepID=UPI000474D68C|nr:styrene monooxygenase/indole monooxygenase family protein [Actinoalloteichus spitiensis]
MRRILIVGSGQSGLQLGLSLLQHDYEVTLMSARTAEEIHDGRVMSTQLMFHPSLEHERAYGLHLWEEETPDAAGVGMSVGGPDGSRAVDWFTSLPGHAHSVDQRLKMSRWLEEFENAGGRVVIHSVTLSDLDGFVGLYDLVIVAAGKGDLVRLFDRDPTRSVYSAPQRVLSVTYVHGMSRRPEHPDVDALRFNIAPGAGEMLTMPSLTTSGPCEILLYEAVPGGPLDAFSDVRDPRAHLERALTLMREHFPWEYERCGDVELTDDRGVLTGAVSPEVRHPVGRLPSGGLVLGMADAVVVNDPISGQGSNNAARCAAVYLRKILDHGDRPFDAEFMHDTFESYWEYARHATTLTNMMLRQPPPAHLMEVFGAIAAHPRIADRFARGVNDASTFDDWLFHEDLAREYLAEVAAGRA